ncbi:MAG: glycine zipper 2TM domain-containing protein [Novosphingobium sp.]
MRLRATAMIAASTVLFVAPAFAHEDGGHSMHHQQGGMQPGWGPQGPGDGGWARQREDWLVECRRRIGGNGRGATGAVLGGVVGGVLGHEVAGRGSRAVGTIAGAAIGAVAGAAIERGSEGRRYRDECEAMLENSQGGYGPGYPQQAYGYAVPMMMVPVTMVSVPMQPKRDCHEHVTTEYVTSYETVYRKVREVRYRSVPTYKRVQVVPDKRVRMVPDKRVMAD